MLVLDVARFKYPPYWVPLEDLWESMSVIDPVTGVPRGYFVVSTWTLSDQQNQSQASATPTGVCMHAVIYMCVMILLMRMFT